MQPGRDQQVRIMNVTLGRIFFFFQNGFFPFAKCRFQQSLNIYKNVQVNKMAFV